MRSGNNSRWVWSVGVIVLVLGAGLIVGVGTHVPSAVAGRNHNHNHNPPPPPPPNPLTQILSKLDQIHGDLTGGVLDPGPRCFTIPPNVILRVLTGGDVVGNDPEQVVNFQQAAHQLVAGERLRTILVNSGPNPINAQVSVLDAGGTVVQAQELVVPPGQMVASTYPSLMPEPGPSGLVRTVVANRAGDIGNLSVSSVVVAPSGGVTSIARVARNHNETLLRDGAAREEQ